MENRTNQIDQEQSSHVPPTGQPGAKGTRNEAVPVKTQTAGTVFTFQAKIVSEQVFNDNQKRNYLLIQNNGAANIFVNFKAPATTKHIKIIPGGNYEPNIIPTGSLHIISTLANNEVAIFEGNQ